MRNEDCARPPLGIGERAQASRRRIHNNTNKNGAAIYDNNTTAITVSNMPILESNLCQHA
jgi:hypothetical protein